MRGILESAVLRFSDQDGPAVPLHEAILASEGFVWWGWWKKEFEPGREGFLGRLRKLALNGGVDVALLNRKDERYFQVRLTDVVFRSGANTGSPGEQCPVQYRDRPEGLPAWFKMTRIDEINERDYIRRFGPVPTGECTLYEVRRDESGESHVYPQPSWNMAPVDAPGNTILHISDLHFGDFHGYRSGPTLPGTKPDRPTLLDRVDRIVDELTDNIGVVVVSGDLVSKGNVEDFHAVEDFLTKLIDRLRLDKRHVVCVPGNHDFSVIETGSLPTVDYGHERAYRAFIERFYGESGTEIERLALFRLPNRRHVAFALLNSARLRGRESKEYGYVGRHRYEEMLDYMEQQIESARLDQVSRFAVLHHHLLPVKELDVPREGTPISLTVDAAELFTELQERGFDAALHGHQHLPFFMRGGRSVFTNASRMNEPRGQLSVIGCGSSGAHTLNPEFAFNALGVYEVTEESLAGTFWRYTDRNRPESFAEFSVPWTT